MTHFFYLDNNLRQFIHNQFYTSVLVVCRHELGNDLQPTEQISVCRITIRGWDYYKKTCLELIRSSRVFAAGSAHNVSSVVTYQSI